MSPDYSKRDYLLPPGCKDLIDVINLEAGQKPKTFELKAEYESIIASDFVLGELPGVPPPIKGEIQVAGNTTVGQLAELIRQKPSRVIADLMLLGVFATVNQVVAFEAINKVARQYGYVAKKHR